MLKHSHPTSIIGIAFLKMAGDSVQLIQKQLKFIADQSYLLLFMATSSLLTHQLTNRHGWANPTVQPVQLWIRPSSASLDVSQQGTEFHGRTSWELCFKALFPEMTYPETEAQGRQH